MDVIKTIEMINFSLAKIQKNCIFATASPTRSAPAKSPRMGT